MDSISRADLNLLAGRDGPCVSIYLPTHRAGNGTQENLIRFKNLLRRAEQELEAEGVRPAEARRLLEPATQLQDEALFWREPGDGLAVFVAEEFLHAWRLPATFEELVVVGRRFHLKPLLPLLIGQGRYHLLALSLKRVRLFEGRRSGLRELPLPAGVPASLEEALQYDNPEKSIQFHTETSAMKGGRRAALYHGQGIGKEEEKNRILRFFWKVDAGLAPFSQRDRTPLVLAGVGYLQPIYREASSFPFIIDEGVEGNPDAMTIDELHRRSWAILEPRRENALEAASSLYLEARAKGRALEDLPDVVRAAVGGRVDLLFVTLDHKVWGTLDSSTLSVVVHERPEPGDEDLLDRAALETLGKGGSVYAVPSEKLPGQTPIAALLRY